MDRRRFIPDSLGLEQRLVMSASPATAAVSAAAATNTSTTTTTDTGTNAETIQQRLQRVQNLPFFLENFQPGRFIPSDSMKQVQENLVLVITRLSPAPTSALANFNMQLRKIGAHTSLSQSDAKTLDFAFGRVLTACHANPQVVANLQEGMRGLARADAASINPTMLAINDYGLVLQVALGIGRPLHAPSVPTLKSSDRLNNALNVSKTATPTLLGTYEANSTMQIIDQQGNVLASAATQSDGQYSIKIATPLPNGTYKLRVRAVDTGIVSKPSKLFSIVIKAPVVSAAVPKGPMKG